MSPKYLMSAAKPRFMMSVSNGEAVVDLYDEIGMWGVGSKQFKEKLDGLGDVKKMTIRVNSPGGDVTEGNAMFNDLMNHKSEKTCVIVGLAASMGSIIPMACDKIQMYRNAFIMIHNPWCYIAGDASALENEAAVLNKMKKNAIDAYKRHSNLSRKAISDLMDAVTWMTAEEALQNGFIDEIIDQEVEADGMMFGKLDIPDRVHQAMMNKSAAPAPFKMQTKPLTGGDSMKCKCGADCADGHTMCAKCLAADAQAKASLREREEAKQQAIVAERARVKDIRTMCIEHKLSADFTAKVIDDGVTLEQARVLVLDEIKKGLVVVAPSASVGTEDSEKRRMQLTAGLLTAMGSGDMLIDDGEKDVKAKDVVRKATAKAHSIHSLIRQSAIAAGMKPESIMNLSGEGLHQLAMDLSAPHRMSSTGAADLTNVLADVQNKVLMSGFENAETTFQNWVAEADVNDFKQIKHIAMSMSERLRKIPSGAAPTLAKFTDKKEVAALDTYGMQLTIPRDVIINDELGAISDMGRKIGASARTGINEAIYDSLCSQSLLGPTMLEDGQVMFDADTVGGYDRYNLIASSGVPTNTTVGTAFGKLMAQKGLGPNRAEAGQVLNRKGKYLIAGTTQINSTFLLTTSPTDPAGVASGVPNFSRVQGLEAVVDAYLQTLLTAGSAANTWYLAVDKLYSPYIVNYLQGRRMPTVTERPSDVGEALGYRWQVIFDWCISARDWRGIIQNDGK
jgi:ATP-dependent Clp endopeptidase proteolytic subunit ClpP